LIVQPEHSAIGSPPVEWWLDDYFKWLDIRYYVALLSAASYFGSNQQAIQETQIISERQRRDVVVGRIRLRFFVKSAAECSITQQWHGAYAPLVVSTVETTIIDLVKYAASIGGIERVAETISPVLSLVKEKKLVTALKVENDIPVAQRLGYLLEALGREDLTRSIKEWIQSPPKQILLSTHYDGIKSGPINKKWNVVNNSGSFV